MIAKKRFLGYVLLKSDFFRAFFIKFFKNFDFEQCLQAAMARHEGSMLGDAALC
jgi:hypothetical protein